MSYFSLSTAGQIKKTELIKKVNSCSQKKESAFAELIDF